MDSIEINSLFNDQKKYKTYVKKDLVRISDATIQAGSDRVKFTCHSLVNKLMDFSEGFILFEGYISSTTANPLNTGDIVDIQNGTNSLFTDVKVSFNNNEVEHNRRPDISTTWFNLLEYSPDYASSNAVQYGFVKDPVLTGANTAATLRGEVGGIDGAVTITPAGGGRPARFVIKYMIPLKYLSQFFRRLNFPIINQLVEIELNLNPVSSIYRVGAQASNITMVSAELVVPEVVLPTEYNNRLVKAISTGKFSKEMIWDGADYIFTNTIVDLGRDFDILIGNNLVGTKKIMFMVHGYLGNQEWVQTGSFIDVSNINIQIDSKDLFNTTIRNDFEAYRLLSENFNSQGKDLNTGSLLPYVEWLERSRLYVFDLSRQEIFESDPNVVQTIRLRGYPSVTNPNPPGGAAPLRGQLMIVLVKNKHTVIDMANPQNTKTI